MQPPPTTHTHTHTYIGTAVLTADKVENEGRGLCLKLIRVPVEKKPTLGHTMKAARSDDIEHGPTGQKTTITWWPSGRENKSVARTNVEERNCRNNWLVVDVAATVICITHTQNAGTSISANEPMVHAVHLAFRNIPAQCGTRCLCVCEWASLWFVCSQTQLVG